MRVCFNCRAVWKLATGNIRMRISYDSYDDIYNIYNIYIIFIMISLPRLVSYFLETCGTW